MWDPTLTSETLRFLHCRAEYGKPRIAVEIYVRNRNRDRNVAVRGQPQH